MISTGWLRLWLLVTVIIGGGLVWQAAITPDLLHEEARRWACVPGTQRSYDEEVVVGERKPTASESAQTRDILKLTMPKLSEADIELQHQLSNYAVMGSRTFYDCSSYLNLLRSLLRGLALCLIPALAFLLIRWVARGFTRKR